MPQQDLKDYGTGFLTGLTDVAKQARAAPALGARPTGS